MPPQEGDRRQPYRHPSAPPALRDTVGEYQQKGSCGTERLRFDFSFAPLTPEEIRRIEEIVNEKIWSLLPVKTRQTSLSEAKEGAIALFGEYTATGAGG